MYKMRVLQVGLGMQMEEAGGGWKNCPILLPQESIQEEMAALTSDHQQLFPQALPATTSPLTVPDIPQPSGQETQTKGLQGAESWGNHTGFSEGAGKKCTDKILFNPLETPGRKKILLNFQYPTYSPKGLAWKFTEPGTGDQIKRVRTKAFCLMCQKPQ